MQDNFEECLNIILKHEGGYVNHPQDPGGETNMGVTKRVYEEFGGTKNMRDLEFDDVAPIYRKNYWDRCKCSELPYGVDLCVFDFAVNSGVSRSAKYLQNIVGAVADGYIGPGTLSKVDDFIYQYGKEELIHSFQNDRQAFYESLKTFETFGRGWTRRVKETTELALDMI